MPVADGMELDDGGSVPSETNGTPSTGEAASLSEPDGLRVPSQPGDESGGDQPDAGQPGDDQPGDQPGD